MQIECKAMLMSLKLSEKSDAIMILACWQCIYSYFCKTNHLTRSSCKPFLYFFSVWKEIQENKLITCQLMLLDDKTTQSVDLSLKVKHSVRILQTNIQNM